MTEDQKIAEAEAQERRLAAAIEAQRRIIEKFNITGRDTKSVRVILNQLEQSLARVKERIAKLRGG